MEKKKREKKERRAGALSDFADFIRGRGVLGLAVGVVIGTAAGVLVNSLINNVVMPPIGKLFGSADGLRGLVWNMGATPSGEEAVMRYGAFISDFINFLMIAVVIYLVIRLLRVETTPRK